MRTIFDICQHLQKLDRYVEKYFLQTLFDVHIPSNIERKLLLLPVELGGMGIGIFADIAKMEYQISRNITESLTKLRLEQTTEYNINREELARLKNNIKKEKLQHNIESPQTLIIELPTNKIRLNEINQEKGASTWLLTLSLKENRYSLPKQKFEDLVKIRYRWPLSRSPNKCSREAKYDLQHSLSCKKIAANLIDQVCHNVRIEFPLQTLAGETFDSISTNVRDEEGWTLVRESFEGNNK